jgi:secreted trypsin-like serine protease
VFRETLVVHCTYLYIFVHLYIFDKEKKEAVLVGVVNRGSGCARRDALGIYARVKFHMKWIKKLANSGRCSLKV